MLQRIDKQNQDITETLKLRGELGLEDAIFQAMDKLDALCAVQSQLEASEGRVSVQTRMHYVMIVEEHVQQLRALLTEHFG